MRGVKVSGEWVEVCPDFKKQHWLEKKGGQKCLVVAAR
jgi:hypothetical protein